MKKPTRKKAPQPPKENFPAYIVKLGNQIACLTRDDHLALRRYCKEKHSMIL